MSRIVGPDPDEVVPQRVDDEAVKFLVLAGAQLGQQPLDSVQKKQALKVAEEPGFTPQVEQCLKIQVNPRADCRGDDTIAPGRQFRQLLRQGGDPDCSELLGHVKRRENLEQFLKLRQAKQNRAPSRRRLPLFQGKLQFGTRRLEELVEEVQRLQMSCHRPFLAKQRMVFVLERGLRVERNGSASHQSVPWWARFDLRREISVARRARALASLRLPSAREALPLLLASLPSRLSRSVGSSCQGSSPRIATE